MAIDIHNDSTGRLRQENCHEFEASLSDILSQKTKKNLCQKYIEISQLSNRKSSRCPQTLRMGHTQKLCWGRRMSHLSEDG